MAGLINQQMPQPDAQPDAQVSDGAQPNDQAPGQGNTGDATQRVFVAALRVIHNQQMSDHLLNIMRSAGDPVQGLVQAAEVVMKGLMERSKGKIPPEAIMPALKGIIGALAELAQAAGLFKPDDALIDKVMQTITSNIEGKQQGPAQPDQGQGGEQAPPSAAGAPPAQPGGMIGRQMTAVA